MYLKRTLSIAYPSGFFPHPPPIGVAVVFAVPLGQRGERGNPRRRLGNLATCKP
jgi:hypothetical protein